MKYIQRITGISVICLLIISLVACGNSKESNEQTNESSSTIVQDEEEGEESSISKEEQRKMINTLLKEIEDMEDGDSTSTATILVKAGYDVYSYYPLDLLDVHSQFAEAAKKNGIILDMSAYEGLAVGMPQNLDFIVRRQ